MTLYNKLHVLCIIKNLKHKIIITSLANIFENRHFLCLEFLNLKETYQLGIEIIQKDRILVKNIFYFFSHKKYNKYKLNKSQENAILCQKFNKNIDIKINLKKTDFLNTNYLRIYYINLEDNEWHFINFFNYYFCLCVGFYCKYETISQKCKYFFYLNIIYNNKDVYKKTDYLLGDFIYNEYSSDDAYPVFEEMIKQKLAAHYLTQRTDIYNKNCEKKDKCLTILPVIKRNEIIDGDFLEKYLT